MIKKLIEDINKSFESHRETRSDAGTFGVKVSLRELEINFINLATDLMDLGYSAIIIEEAGEMTLTVLKKY